MSEQESQSLGLQLSDKFVARLAKLNRIPDSEMRTRLMSYIDDHPDVTIPRLFDGFSRNLGKGKPHGLNKQEGKPRGKKIW